MSKSRHTKKAHPQMAPISTSIAKRTKIKYCRIVSNFNEYSIVAFMFCGCFENITELLVFVNRYVLASMFGTVYS